MTKFRELLLIQIHPCISRANIKGQEIAYYANASDISIIEACRFALKPRQKENLD